MTIRGNDLPGKAGIYMIRNLVNGRTYIGHSRAILQRWFYHLSTLRCKRHRSKDLQDDWSRYGASNFEFLVLEHTNNLCARETAWIKKLESEDCLLYNIKKIAKTAWPTKRLAVEIPSELYDDFKSEVAKLGVTTRDVIIELVNKWLQVKEENHEKQPDARH